MKSVEKILAKILEMVSSVCLVIFCVVSFLQIVARYLGFSVVWTEEVARFSFIYMVFTGCTVGVHRDAHYKFDIFGKMKNKVIAISAHIITFLFQLFFFAFLLYTSLRFIPQMQARASSILRIPVSIPYSAIVVFAAISLLFIVLQTVDYVKSLTASSLTQAEKEGEQLL